VATATSTIARAGTAGQTARAFAARGQGVAADMLDANGGGRRPGERGASEKKKGMPLMLIVVVVIAILPIILGAYIMLAPDTMWKPLYVRVEMEDVTPVAGVASPAGAALAPTDSYALQQPQQQHLQPLQPLHPPTLVPVATVPPLHQPGPGIMYQLGTKIVNLADPGGLRYLQTSIVLELHPELNAYLAAQDAATGTATASGAESGGHGAGGEADTAALSALDARRPIIDDVVMTTLSSKRYSDVSTIKGKQTLKEELIAAINKALGVPGVLNIYFTEFVVQ
jgi:flagellar basal body-associated protein FliL